MLRKIAFILIFALFTQINIVHAGSTGSEDLTKTNSNDTAGECFEGFSRAMFKLNHGLDKVVFEPVAKGYRALPVPIRKGTGNVVNNLRSLLTFSNNWAACLFIVLSGINFNCFLSVIGAVAQEGIIKPHVQPPNISRNFLLFMLLILLIKINGILNV